LVLLLLLHVQVGFVAMAVGLVVVANRAALSVVLVVR